MRTSGYRIRLKRLLAEPNIGGTYIEHYLCVKLSIASFSDVDIIIFLLFLYFFSRSDIMSLSAPDGIFLTAIQRALQKLAHRSMSKKRGDPIIVRIMLSNYLAKPCDCTEVLETLTKDLPEDANLHIWVRNIMGGYQANFDDLKKS